MNTNTTVRVGPGFPSLLGLAFIILKLVGVITWSWVWVLAPIWIPIALVLFIILLICVGKVLWG
jgi:hypothetical protein